MTDYSVFPIWIVITHFLNMLFILFLARSGLEVLSACPKFYWNDHCMPGREWLRLTKKTFSAESARPWSSLEEEDSWSPVVALPGRKNLGIGRHWHFMSIQFWILTGAVYIALLFSSGYYRTIVPTSWAIFPNALRAAGDYLQFHLPPAQPGLPFNAAQQLSYFAVVFLLAPLQILTGAAMSPAVIGRFPGYARLFGGRQRARSLHFIGLCLFVAFIAVHTLMVILSGLPELWTVMVLGHRERPPYTDQGLALAIGLAGLFGIVVLNVVATLVSLRYRRSVQRFLGIVVDPFERLLSRVFTSRQGYSWADVSPYFRVNGYPPPDEHYRTLAANGFAEYRLEIAGLVEHPLLLGLEELRALGWTSQIVLHNCIQGWSAVAQWGGVPMAKVLEAVKPKPNARHIAFYAFDDKSVTENEGRSGHFYGTIPLHLALKPQTILALEMNRKPLPVEHGAPVRLRIETQLGFKMVKWVRAIEFVEDYAAIGQGQGGWREDQQYYANAAGI
ncbi:molybdopterin-dependent oxidoreductase [Candidatus Aeolococcus gillhamiae]